VVAHRKKNQPTLRLKQVRKTVDTLKPILWDLYFVATPGIDMHIELGGGANPDRFARALSKLLSDPAGGPA
jgi:hypothetical protein